MGYISAYDTIGYLDGDLRKAVSLHFQSNCYPPVPQFMVDVALDAIHSIVVGDHAGVIDLPEGVTFRGHDSVSAMEVVDSLHLEAFVDWVLNNEEESE